MVDWAITFLVNFFLFVFSKIEKSGSVGRRKSARAPEGGLQYEIDGGARRKFELDP